MIRMVGIFNALPTKWSRAYTLLMDHDMFNVPLSIETLSPIQHSPALPVPNPTLSISPTLTLSLLLKVHRTIVMTPARHHILCTNYTGPSLNVPHGYMTMLARLTRKIEKIIEHLDTAPKYPHRVRMAPRRKIFRC